jgi:phosphoesterase RecJ-like protein
VGPGLLPGLRRPGACRRRHARGQKGEAHAERRSPHHQRVYGEYNYLDFSAAAVGELAFLLLRELGLAIDPTIATCIYTSIVADTGGFKYDSTAPRTHRIAAELLEAGAKPYEVASAIFENESMARLALLSQVLATLHVDPSGKIASVHVTREMLEQTGAAEEDVEGMVNYARSVMGVEVGMLFRETSEGSIRVGLRSRRHVDVGAVAKQFGGGGHARASGCGLHTSMEEAKVRVLNAVRAAF